MTPERFVVNDERAEWVVRTLIDAWRRKLPPFDHAEPVPSLLPKTLVRGSTAHAVWLMVGLLYMRGRIDSAQAFIRLAKVFDLYPEFFEPKNFLRIGLQKMSFRAKLQEVLRENGLGFNVRESVRFWDFNLRKLSIFWDDNPIRIFETASDYDSLCHIFMTGKGNPSIPMGFMGLRHKMVSMFIYFLTKARLIEPLMHPGPVDTHNIRVLASTEVITPVEGITPGTRYEFYEVSPIGREVYLKYCKTVDEILDLSDALWYLSRDFCSLSQGNGSHAGKYRARATETRPKRVAWTEERVRAYGKSCGLCPVESVCKWSLPTARQYNQGFLEVRTPRPKPHLHQIKLIEVEKQISRRDTRPPKRELPIFEPHPSLFD